MTRTRFKDILQKLHFSNNTEDDKKDKGYKDFPLDWPLITHFEESSSLCIRWRYSNVYEHMLKFKGWSSMKKYVKNKPIKWCFKFWYRCASKTGYFYQFDLLGKNATLALTENTYCNIFSTIFSTVLELLQSYLTKVPMQLEVLKKQERHARNDGRQKTWREAIASFCFPKKWLAVNAKKISINSSSQGLMQPKNDSS